MRLVEKVRAQDLSAQALLKLDVQGFELDSLAGCEDLINYFSWVYVECSFVKLYQGQSFADEVIAWLSEKAFSLKGVYNLIYDQKGKAIQADFLFHRKSARPPSIEK